MTTKEHPLTTQVCTYISLIFNVEAQLHKQNFCAPTHLYKQP